MKKEAGSAYPKEWVSENVVVCFLIDFVEIKSSKQNN